MMQAAARGRSGIVVSVAKRRSSSRRRFWVMACPGGCFWVGMSRQAGMWPWLAAQVRKGADGEPLVGAAGVVVGVDVGLGECRRADVGGEGPGQECLSLGEAALGVLAGGGRQRASSGAGPHDGELVPLPELAKQPQV